MIKLILICFALGAAAFFATYRLDLPKRIAIALCVAVLPCLVVIAALYSKMDSPPENSRVITDDELQRKGKKE